MAKSSSVHGFGASAAVLGGLSSATGSILTGLLSSSTADLEAEMLLEQAAFNQEIAEIYARDAISRAEDDIRAVRIRERLNIGQQRSSFASQGVDVSTGSAAEVQKQTAQFSAEDEINIRMNAEFEAMGIQSKAINIASQASFNAISAQNRGNQQLVGGFMDAGRTVLGTTAELSKRYESISPRVGSKRRG